MKKSPRTKLSAAIILTIGLLSALASADSGSAVTDAGVATVVDAGVGSGSGSSAPPVFHNVTSDPIGFIADMKDLWHKGGWSLALMLGVIGALELAVWLGKNNATLAWLGKGRTTIVIGAAAATFAAMLNAMLGGGAWQSALVTGVGAGLAFWHQAGTDPAKA